MPPLSCAVNVSFVFPAVVRGYFLLLLLLIT